MTGRALIGVNIPWFGGQYGHDLAPNERHPQWGCQFDLALADRTLGEARELGFDAVRVWLCENGEGVRTDAAGRVTGVHPTLLANLDALQTLCLRRGLRAYWTVLDANAVDREGDPVTRAALASEPDAARFGACVIAPIVRVLDPSLTVALELVNEPEAVTADCRSPTATGPSVSWDELGRCLRALGAAARAERAGSVITAGTMHVYLPRLWRCGAGLDAADVHVYHAHGGLPSREDLARHVGDAGFDAAVPLFAGECGTPDRLGEAAHPRLSHYVYNADRAGYAAAFLWRLEGALVRREGRHFTDTAAVIRDTLRARAER